MKATYKIQISLTPNYEDNHFKPFSWVLMKKSNESWCNEGFGWELSPERAWFEAYKFYQSFKR